MAAGTLRQMALLFAMLAASGSAVRAQDPTTAPRRDSILVADSLGSRQRPRAECAAGKSHGSVRTPTLWHRRRTRAAPGEALPRPLEREAARRGARSPREAGGLTPYREGGNAQTRSLRFRGADSLNYVFRSLEKDPTRNGRKTSATRSRRESSRTRSARCIPARPSSWPSWSRRRASSTRRRGWSGFPMIHAWASTARATAARSASSRSGRPRAHADPRARGRAKDRQHGRTVRGRSRRARATR